MALVSLKKALIVSIIVAIITVGSYLKCETRRSLCTQIQQHSTCTFFAFTIRIAPCASRCGTIILKQIRIVRVNATIKLKMSGNGKKWGESTAAGNIKNGCSKHSERQHLTLSAKHSCPSVPELIGKEKKLRAEEKKWWKLKRRAVDGYVYFRRESVVVVADVVVGKNSDTTVNISFWL